VSGKTHLSFSEHLFSHVQVDGMSAWRHPSYCPQGCTPPNSPVCTSQIVVEDLRDLSCLAESQEQLPSIKALRPGLSPTTLNIAQVGELFEAQNVRGKTAQSDLEPPSFNRFLTHGAPSGKVREDFA
jgi:hypothetical protein